MSFGRTPCYIYASTWQGEVPGFSFNRLNGSEELEAGMPRSQFISDKEFAQLLYHMSQRSGWIEEYLQMGQDLD